MFHRLDCEEVKVIRQLELVNYMTNYLINQIFKFSLVVLPGNHFYISLILRAAVANEKGGTVTIH